MKKADSVSPEAVALTASTQTAKLNRRLRSAKALAAWPNQPLIRAFGRLMVRRLTNAIERVHGW